MAEVIIWVVPSETEPARRLVVEIPEHKVVFENEDDAATFAERLADLLNEVDPNTAGVMEG